MYLPCTVYIMEVLRGKEHEIIQRELNSSIFVIKSNRYSDNRIHMTLCSGICGEKRAPAQETTPLGNFSRIVAATLNSCYTHIL